MRRLAIFSIFLITAVFTTGVLAAMRTDDTAEVPTSVVAARSDRVREGDVRFKTTCTFDHSASDDPIVYPNQPGASHLHDFTGRRGITASTTTYAQLIQGRTTCNDPGDLAGYWTPTASAGSSKLIPTRMTAYYRLGSKVGTIQPYPDGLKIVAEGGLSGWQCADEDRNDPKPTPAGCTTTAVAVVAFPSCWDGVNTDSVVDHRSHMAYGTVNDGVRTCPTTHPVPVPELTTYTHYDLPAGRTITSLSSGDPSTLHGDFFNGWLRSRLIERIDTCLNQLRRCDSGG